ncbi:MAG: DHH family phosphoesterase, partial [Lachnospiraceae bacterium]|nr:DHH family phosphoesterase [Lachnospiraceae bacterium]
MERVDIKTEVNRYLQRPFHFASLWVVTDVLLFAFSGRKAGLIGTAGLLVYLLVAGLFYGRKKSKLNRELVTFAARYGQVQNRLLKEFILPYALLDSRGTVLWMNDAFAELSGKDGDYHKNIAALYPEITGARLPGEEMKSEVTVAKNGKTYRAALQVIVMEELLEGAEFIDFEEDLERNSVV